MHGATIKIDHENVSLNKDLNVYFLIFMLRTVMIETGIIEKIGKIIIKL